MASPPSNADDDHHLLLIQSALEAMGNSYNIYSHFPVGAAILTSTGLIFKGTNVENSSYGATICAERSAICAAVSSGHKQFRAISVVTELEEPGSPCGMCRQFMIEFGEYEVILFSPSSNRKVITSTGELLPNAFTPHRLAEHNPK